VLLLCIYTISRRREERGGRELPKRISYDQERNVDVLSVVKYIIARTLYHLPICKDNFSAIVLFLLSISVSSKLPLQTKEYRPEYSCRRGEWMCMLLNRHAKQS
jgi:hypothetical protein